MYYTWESQEAFDAWHSSAKAALGIPRANRNSKTGDVDTSAAWTVEYTQLQTDDNGVLFAKVEDEVANNLPEGLGTPHEPLLGTGDIS